MSSRPVQQPRPVLGQAYVWTGQDIGTRSRPPDPNIGKQVWYYKEGAYHISHVEKLVTRLKAYTARTAENHEVELIKALEWKRRRAKDGYWGFEAKKADVADPEVVGLAEALGRATVQDDTVAGDTAASDTCPHCDDTEQCILRNHPSLPSSKAARVVEWDELQRYKYPDWDVGSSRRAQNVQWLTAHESRIVCVLSVSLMSIVDGERDFKRKGLLMQALASWAQQGWYVLLFVPLAYHKEYRNCLGTETTDWGAQGSADSVRLVTYDVSPQPCNHGMVVGESRNAVLGFVALHKAIFKTCTVADERVTAVKFTLRNSGKISKKDISTCKGYESRYGYAVLAASKAMMASNTARETEVVRRAFEDLEAEFQTDWSQYPKAQKHLWPVKIYSKKDTPHSVWHQLLDREPSLLGYCSGSRYMSIVAKQKDASVFASGKTQKGEVISQLTTFRVGGAPGWANTDTKRKGWHGQQNYVRATMCEDNVWSYDWSTGSDDMGEVAEMRCLTFDRQTHGIKSLTRRKVNLANYTPCALHALLRACASDSYQNTPDGHVVMKWTNKCDNHIRLTLQKNPKSSDYWEMANLLAGLAKECRRRNISVSDKVQTMCQRLGDAGVQLIGAPSGVSSSSSSSSSFSRLSHLTLASSKVGAESSWGAVFDVQSTQFGPCLLKVFHADPRYQNLHMAFQERASPRSFSQQQELVTRELRISTKASTLGVGAKVFQTGVFTPPELAAFTNLASGLRDLPVMGSVTGYILMERIGQSEDPPWSFSYFVGRMPLRLAARATKRRVGDDAMAKMETLHRNGILHRDLHGSNVLVRRSDLRVFLIDYGAAIETATPTVEDELRSASTASSLARYCLRRRAEGRPVPENPEDFNGGKDVPRS